MLCADVRLMQDHNLLFFLQTLSIDSLVISSLASSHQKAHLHIGGSPLAKANRIFESSGFHTRSIIKPVVIKSSQNSKSLVILPNLLGYVNCIHNCLSEYRARSHEYRFLEILLSPLNS